jgi:hypothetical protein
MIAIRTARFRIKNSAFCLHSLFMYDSQEETAIISLNIIKRLVCEM